MNETDSISKLSEYFLCVTAVLNVTVDTKYIVGLRYEAREKRRR